MTVHSLVLCQKEGVGEPDWAPAFIPVLSTYRRWQAAWACTSVPFLPQSASKLALASLSNFCQAFYHKKKSSQDINLRLLSIKIDACSIESNLHLYGTNGNKPMLELSKLEKEITRRWWFWKVGIKGLVMTYSTLRKQWHQDQGKLGKRFSLESRWASIHFEILAYRVRSKNIENVSIQLELKSNSEMVIKISLRRVWDLSHSEGKQKQIMGVLPSWGLADTAIWLGTYLFQKENQLVANYQHLHILLDIVPVHWTLVSLRVRWNGSNK